MRSTSGRHHGCTSPTERLATVGVHWARCCTCRCGWKRIQALRLGMEGRQLPRGEEPARTARLQQARRATMQPGLPGRQARRERQVQQMRRLRRVLHQQWRQQRQSSSSSRPPAAAGSWQSRARQAPSASDSSKVCSVGCLLANDRCNTGASLPRCLLSTWGAELIPSKQQQRVRAVGALASGTPRTRQCAGLGRKWQETQDHLSPHAELGLGWCRCRSNVHAAISMQAFLAGGAHEHTKCCLAVREAYGAAGERADTDK